VTPLTNVHSGAIESDDVSEHERIPTGTPYLSVVATARNDNHGGDLLARMQVFVNGLADQCERHRVEAELILVEWNPPADRPRLADALEWPETPWCTIRIVDVPHELHASLRYSDRLPLFQMIAKNVGIRRARGEFVLATNVDILVPDGLMAVIARRELRPDRLYRVDRHDVDIVPDPGLTTEETLRLCEANVIRICSRMTTTDLVTGEVYRIYESRRLPLFARRLLYFWRALEHRFRNLAAYFVGGVKLCAILMRGLVAALFHRKAPALEMTGHIPHVSLRTLTPRRLWRRMVRNIQLMLTAWEAEAARIPLHTNASGDFTLLSRDAWETTRAYPELQMFSMHIDALFLYEAHYAGFAEEELPHPLFHIEHNQGFKPAPKDVRTLNTRLARAAIPQITNEQFMRWITTMYRTHEPIVFNDDGWGFACVALREAESVPALEEAPA
jgi:hypothetical protein